MLHRPQSKQKAYFRVDSSRLTLRISAQHIERNGTHFILHGTYDPILYFQNFKRNKEKKNSHKFNAKTNDKSNILIGKL